MRERRGPGSRSSSEVSSPGLLSCSYTLHASHHIRATYFTPLKHMCHTTCIPAVHTTCFIAHAHYTCHTTYIPAVHVTHSIPRMFLHMRTMFHTSHIAICTMHFTSHASVYLGCMHLCHSHSTHLYACRPSITEQALERNLKFLSSP